MKKELAFLFAVITSYTFFYINLPPWWDGITTAVTAITSVKTNIDLYPDFFGKPPFIFITLGSLFKIFGYSPAISHLYMLVFSLVAAYFTYKVGELLSCKEVGIAASYFLVFSPLFIAQSVNLNFDLPAMALIMASYYYLLKKDYLVYVLTGTMLIMTKEVGMLFIAAAGFSALLRKDWKMILAQLIPAFIFVVWLYGNYTRHGWFIFPRDSPLLKLETIWNDNLVMRLAQLFVLNFNWILTFIALLSIIAWLYRHHNRIDHGRINQIMPMAFFVLFFFLSVGPIREFNLPRYVLVLYPALYLLSAWALYSFFEKNKKISAGIIILILALFMVQTVFSTYSHDPYDFIDPATKKIYEEKQNITLGGSEALETNLKYVDYVKADIELVRYLNTTDRSIPLILNRFNHYSIFIAANKGIDIGYGQKYPREYKELGDFYNSPDTISFPAILVIEDFNKFDLEKLDLMYNLTFLEKIRVNGVGADVYQINKG